jgi:DNA-binding CsgD family transcriptional regulator
MADRLRTNYEWTPRQRQVLDLLTRGRTNGEIGEALGISLDGAKWHVAEVMSKLGATTREEAAEYWRAYNGLGRRFERVFRGVVAAHAVRWIVAGAGMAGLAAAAAIVVLALRAGDGGQPGPAVSAAAGAGDAAFQCAAQASAVVHPAFRPAAGPGPIYMMLGTNPSAGQDTLVYHPPTARQNWAARMSSSSWSPPTPGRSRSPGPGSTRRASSGSKEPARPCCARPPSPRGRASR